MTRSLSLNNPKLKLRAGDTPWYEYYAGYSSDFVRTALRTFADGSQTLLDPWNGGGTTTTVASSEGVPAVGYDANPAAVLVAKARLLGAEVLESLAPLTQEILTVAASNRATGYEPNEPLETWFSPSSARLIRSLERAVYQTLVKSGCDALLMERQSLRGISSLAAYFYLTVFRTIRPLLSPFTGTNPTWIRQPRPGESTVEFEIAELHAAFRHTQATLEALVSQASTGVKDSEVVVDVARSQTLPVPDDSIGLVVTSPPYCTRIDYVVAMGPELALLGYGREDLRQLRGGMIGTPTMVGGCSRADADYGQTASVFLAAVERHGSHASKRYYLKYYHQYFDAMWESLKELRRVASPVSRTVLVVQDSYYKERHLDLQSAIGDMARNVGWANVDRHDFPAASSKAAMNPRVRRYRASFAAMESILVLG